jgi:hypothetical protein
MIVDDESESIFTATQGRVLDPVEGTENEQLDGFLVSSLKDDLLGQFDLLGPKLSALERSFTKTITQLKQSRFEPSGNVADDFASIQSNLREMRNRSVSLARQVQALSLGTQVASTLAVPRLLRPLNDAFCDFRDDFDDSIRNIASLTSMLSGKIGVLRTKLDPLRSFPKTIGIARERIASLTATCAEHQKVIAALHSQTTEAIDSVSKRIREKLEASIRESESALAQIMEFADKGISESEAAAMRARAEQESLTNSLSGLSREIESGMKKRIRRLNTGIDMGTQRTGQVISEMKERISVILEDLMTEQAPERELDFLDQLELIEQEAELQKLLVRLDRLARRLHEVQNTAPEGEDDDDEAEVYVRNVDGVEVKYYCMPDGTFHF